MQREFLEIFELLLPSELSQSHLDRLDRTQWSKNAKTSKRQTYLKCLHRKGLLNPSHFSGYFYIFGMDSLIHSPLLTYAAPPFKRAANLNNNSPLRCVHRHESDQQQQQQQHQIIKPQHHHHQ